MIKFDENDLNNAKNAIMQSPRYGYDIDIKVLKAYPNNNDEQIIAMKVALIDMLNSTHLSLHIGEIFLKDIIEKLKDPKTDFDRRCKIGDVSLVIELINWSIDKGKNLFSFFSKYCVFHNVYIYNRDDFVIFDKILKEHLGDYICLSDYERLFGVTLNKRTKIHNEIERMREDKNNGYTNYLKLIDKILELNNIDIKFPNRRRKLDQLIWWRNR